MRAPWLLGSFALACAACGVGGAPEDGSGLPADAGESASDGAAADAAPGETPPPDFTRYPGDAVSSPITASVAARLQEIAARDPGRDDAVFMKVGASGTVSHNLLYCFAGPDQPQYRLDLGGRDELLPTLDWFRAGRVAGTTPFDRATIAAKVGRTAAWVQSGDPSPLAQEIAATNPRFGFVNYGTNDMEMGITYASALPGFYEWMSRLLDGLEDGGIIPIISGLNPRSDSADAARWVPTYDAVTRGMAEARQLPYLSLYHASAPLPDLGLSADGLHGNVYTEDGAAQPCVLTPAGLQFNYDLRNWLSLAALDGALRVVSGGEDAPDVPPLPPLEGDGTPERPFVIDRLPFTHAWDTRRGTSVVARWSCASQDEGGPEVYYRLALSESTPIRAVVLDRGSVDVDVHLGTLTGGTCVARGDVVAEKRLAAGEHAVIVDSFVSSGRARAGPYLLAVVRCEDGDPRCD